MTQSRSHFQWRWAHVTGYTQVVTGPGILHTIVLNQMPKQATFWIWDGIGVGTNAIGWVRTDFDQLRTLVYDLKFDDGLFLAVPGAVDVTVTYM